MSGGRRCSENLLLTAPSVTPTTWLTTTERAVANWLSACEAALLPSDRPLSGRRGTGRDERSAGGGQPPVEGSHWGQKLKQLEEPRFTRDVIL